MPVDWISIFILGSGLKCTVHRSSVMTEKDYRVTVKEARIDQVLILKQPILFSIHAKFY